MKLKYRILWFEDNVSWFNTTSRNIDGFLEDHGFQLNAKRYSNDQEGIIQILGKYDYDLILMDLKLDGAFGNDIIESIRNVDLYTEIIFYSQSDVQEIRATISGKGIDGLYCTSRNNDEFEDKVTKIIRNTIKKVEDVNNMRGLVIAETIDLENKIKLMLKSYFSIESGLVLDEARSRIYKNICDKKKLQFEQEKLIIDEIHNGNMDSLLEILTSANLFQALQSLLKEDLRITNEKLSTPLDDEEKNVWNMRKQSIQLLKIQLNKYDDEIIKLRNTLAHVIEKVNEEGLSYLESIHRNGTTIIFDNDKYVDIRKTLRQHTENLSDIQISLFSDKDYKNEAASSN